MQIFYFLVDGWPISFLNWNFRKNANFVRSTRKITPPWDGRKIVSPLQKFHLFRRELPHWPPRLLGPPGPARKQLTWMDTFEETINDLTRWFVAKNHQIWLMTSLEIDIQWWQGWWCFHCEQTCTFVFCILSFTCTFVLYSNKLLTLVRMARATMAASPTSEAHRDIDIWGLERQ